ncbi:MAG: lipid-binding SYLF domain-containing protein [Phycisphaerales bacterium]
MHLRSSSSALVAAAVLAGSFVLCVSGCMSDATWTDSSGSSASGPSSKAAQLGADSQAAYQQLLANDYGAAGLAPSAKAVLVFPKIVKGGFIVGGFTGDGAMLKNGQPVAYYNTSGGSYGLQAGLQKYAYALFFMSDEDLRYLDKSDGWEVGTAPNVTIVDKGLAGSLSTTTIRKGVYCFFFDERGLMAGLGLQGSKITQINP